MSKIRSDLAKAYQIISMLGLDDLTYTHLSARSEDNDCYYIYPFGLTFGEVKAENLLKVNLDGKVLEGREEQYNLTGYIIHGNIYKARPELNAIFHLHTPYNVAVSAMQEGLLPISQWALHFYNLVSYHQYNSLCIDDAKHGNKLVKDLDKNDIMFLRNHGTLTCGKTIQEAMFNTYHLELACKSQCIALAANTKLTLPNKEICDKSVQDLRSFEPNLGERDWKAWLRLLKQNQ